MPNTREKLIELLCQAQDYGTKHTNEQWSVTVESKCNKTIANHLIANGVTVRECGRWEDDHGDYFCSCCHAAFTDEIVWIVRGKSSEPNYCPNCGAKMIPQPPKGE
jgi:hypothetical protein